MPELGPYGSVRGAVGNSRPYREHLKKAGECPFMTAGSTGHCNTARSLSAGVSKPKVKRPSITRLEVTRRRHTMLTWLGAT